MSKASERYLAALTRLVEGKPIAVPRGTPISQNAVSIEAGNDPSALKKSRFPKVVEAIQDIVKASKSPKDAVSGVRGGSKVTKGDRAPSGESSAQNGRRSAAKDCAVFAKKAAIAREVTLERLVFEQEQELRELKERLRQLAAKGGQRR